MGNVQPAFVDAERLHQIGVLIIDCVDPPGVFVISLMVGRQQNQVRAFLPGLPDRFRRLNAVFFCRVILRQDDAVAGGRIAADGGRNVFQLRVGQQFHRRVMLRKKRLSMFEMLLL